MILLLCLSTLLWEDPFLSPHPAPKVAAPSRFEIPFTEEEPHLDDFQGMTPNSKIANNMIMVRDFVQRVPSNNTPASEYTRVFLSYDTENLYVVFLAFDKRASEMRAHMAPREKIDDDDTVNIMIDTFNDQRRAVVFRANPMGVQWDAIWSENASMDASFDAIWKSDSRVTDRGYMVKMAIPFRSLRYQNGANQTWRVMFNRDIPREGEETYWPQYSGDIQGRLTQAAEMVITHDLSQGRNYQLNPFSSVRSYDALDRDKGAFVSDDLDESLGLDAKFVFKDKYVLDVAVNPDFSQVESDQPQANANARFESFFPEKRPFFLENSDLFSTPFDLVFTRRIRDPEVGLRFTGKAGKTAFGTLVMNDEAPGRNFAPGEEGYEEAAQIGIVRATHDLRDGSHLGALITHRDFMDVTNQVFALDNKWVLKDNWRLTSQLAGSKTRDGNEELAGHALTTTLATGTNHYFFKVNYAEVDEEFRTHMGFMNGRERAGSRNLNGFVNYRWKPDGKIIQAYGPDLWLNQLWAQEGGNLLKAVWPSFSLNFRGNTNIKTGGFTRTERLRPENFSGLAKDRNYEQSGWYLALDSAYFSAVKFRVQFDHFGAINYTAPIAPGEAENRFWNVGMSLRPLGRLKIDGTLLYQKLGDKLSGENAFSNRIVRSALSWQFTRTASMRLIGQYETLNVNPLYTTLEKRRAVNGDFLFTWMLHPGTALYVGYNSNWQNLALTELNDPNERVIRTDHRLLQDSKQFFLKFSYLFNG